MWSGRGIDMYITSEEVAGNNSVTSGGYSFAARKGEGEVRRVGRDRSGKMKFVAA